MSAVFKWSSLEGHALARRILDATPLPYDPHDHQIEGVCCSLDGVHLLAITPTGSGKTGFYTMYILVILAVLRDPTLCPTAKFPTNPCLIVICPTIPLQLEMAEKMCSVGLSALAINTNTREEAQRLRGEDLWKTARISSNVIIAGPEQLKTDEFEKALRDSAFFDRCCGTGFDEVHLLTTWGPRFRQDFLQMGYLLGKCPPKNRRTRIRLYNSMNFDSHNEETRGLLKNPDIDSSCQIVIGTDTLSVGINIAFRQDAIIIGDVEDADELVQKGGRVGRDRKLVNDARVIVYVTQAAHAAAEKALRERDLPLAAKSTPPDLSMVEMTVAKCKIEAQNRLYNNPPSDPPCKCLSCVDDPPPPARTLCNCSGCLPETIKPPPKPSAAPKPIDEIPKHKRLSKLQRAHGTNRLLALQRDI
ncbi:hypothetical protein B0H17DRAFT_1127196 [Mycena rosella]|uniref:Helicase ATP-binding domain-containing protein n=1 Tax=Mycena rosella TaxID=1033263 RepID=A0AAD7DZU1_MYCRO|nr:hypothetical protein B0H17DRAFT_1127196 [Mycena rosella]